MNREQVIYDMCMTFRHDFGIEISDDDSMYSLTSGMTRTEREALFNSMAQVFDHNIAPLLNKQMNLDTTR